MTKEVGSDAVVVAAAATIEEEREGLVKAGTRGTYQPRRAVSRGSSEDGAAMKRHGTARNQKATYDGDARPCRKTENMTHHDAARRQRTTSMWQDLAA